jgi:hypothetical protein
MTDIYPFAPFFLGRSNGMATDIGSLAPGRDGHELGLGIELKITKNRENLTFFEVHSSSRLSKEDCYSTNIDQAFSSPFSSSLH